VAAVGAQLGERVRAGDARTFVPDHPDLAGRALALPVAATGTPEGIPRAAPRAWLVAAKDGGGLSEFDRLTLHQAVTIVALELLRQRVAEDTERRLAGDILDEIVSGELAGPELGRRLEPFGLGDGAAALVLAPDRPALAACEAALAAAVRDETAAGLVASAGQLTCALLPAGEEDEVFALANRLHARVEEELGGPLLAGVGRPVSAGDARRSYHEARCAFEARRLGGAAADGDGSANGAGPPPVATYRDLGSFQLLLSLQDNDALRLFCDSILGPIENGEGHYGGELMRSLEAFIEENGQWERAAKRLYCHRHTLRYRIRKVEELTGRDLASARDRIEFWLALRGRELVR
jgi:PucR family transcriptional regulator, purine catabolism regulatory protein